jgi:PAS domain S-box-containing protein
MEVYNMDINDPVLQPSIALFQVVLDALPFCVFWKDRDSVGLGCNQALANVAGLNSPKEYIGKTDYDLPWTTEEAKFFRECDHRVMDSGEAELNIIESQKQANGAIAWLETSKIPLIDPNGTVIGILGAFHDITERKRIEDENIASQKLDSLSALAAGLAHDFNNVLGIILASSQLAKIKIAQGADEATVLRYLSNIENATKSASSLTEKFMNYSKRGQVTKVVCELSEMIKESISFVQSSINSPIKYESYYPDSILYADVNQLHQVMNNLLINASQASTDSDEIHVDIQSCDLKQSNHLSLHAGNYYAISIKDNGSGMTEQQKENIFKPYFTTKDSGHGLGLSSCQTIIKNHNGAIEVKSEVGSGSTFTIYLPFSLSKNDNAVIPRPFSTELVHGSGRILYIEDDLNTQASTLEIFQSLGYDIKCYADLSLAADYIKEHPNHFDMVITDFIIGNNLQGGLEVLDAVRLTRPNCPVVLLTGYFAHLHKQKNHNNEFSYIAQKPMDLAKISQIISTFIKSEAEVNPSIAIVMN